MVKFKPAPIKGMVRKEVKINHEGHEYVLVLSVNPQKLEHASRMAMHGKGTRVTQGELFDMTAFREGKQS